MRIVLTSEFIAVVQHVVDRACVDFLTSASLFVLFLPTAALDRLFGDLLLFECFSPQVCLLSLPCFSQRFVEIGKVVQIGRLNVIETFLSIVVMIDSF